MIIKIRMGDFFPRVESVMPTEDGRRCHILGARVVELQGGIGVTEVAVRNKDARGACEGLSRIEHAAEEIKKRLPEERETANQLKTRAKQLKEIVEPYCVGYGGDDTMPKDLASVVGSQIDAMGDHDLTIEGSSIAACGGMPGYIHTAKKRPGKLPLLPKHLVAEMARKRADKKKAEAKRIADSQKAYTKKLAARNKKRR